MKIGLLLYMELLINNYINVCEVNIWILFIVFVIDVNKLVI